MSDIFTRVEAAPIESGIDLRMPQTGYLASNGDYDPEDTQPTPIPPPPTNVLPNVAIIPENWIYKRRGESFGNTQVSFVTRYNETDFTAITFIV